MRSTIPLSLATARSCRCSAKGATRSKINLGINNRIPACGIRPPDPPASEAVKRPWPSAAAYSGDVITASVAQYQHASEPASTRLKTNAKAIESPQQCVPQVPEAAALMSVNSAHFATFVTVLSAQLMLA